MNHRDILAIGTSAGGYEALRFLARELPADLPACVLVVIHLVPEFNSGLDQILSKAGALDERIALTHKLHQQSSAPGHKMQRADEIAARYGDADAAQEAGATAELGARQRKWAR